MSEKVAIVRGEPLDKSTIEQKSEVGSVGFNKLNYTGSSSKSLLVVEQSREAPKLRTPTYFDPAPAVCFRKMTVER